jgi:heme/copper-type cytochrome/quinol oxidase subunit 2
MHAANGGVATTRLGVSALEVGRRLGPLVAGYVMPFLLVFYLAMKGGGYDAVVRSQVGIAVWWIVLLGAAVGALPVARLSRSAWAMFGLLAAFCAWTALSIGWSESGERSAAELARVAVYLGVFALALTAHGREGLRRTVYSIGAAIAVVAGLALLSRLHPSWFPNTAPSEALGARNRLNYPLNYWNGLAALIAIGVPLLVWIATSARHIATRALAASALPVMCLAGFYTLSRGSALELAVALVVLLALHPRRLSLLPTLAVAGLGTALAIAAATQRDALANGFSGHTAAAQGDEMLAVVLVSAAALGLLQVAIALCARYQLGPDPQVSHSTAVVATITVGVVALVVALTAGLPGELSDRWQEFKDPSGAGGTTAQRFESASGGGRYQLWQSALDANTSEPLTGIGAGTFEYWWSREGTIPAFVRDAHSLYLETLAELGIVGLLLLGGLIVFVLSSGVVRALRAEPDHRALLAAATAACFAFATAAAIDWVWELAVLPVLFLLLAAAIVGRSEPSETSEQTRPGGSPLPRIALVVVAIAAIVAVAIPLASTSSVRASQDHANSAQLDAALTEAQTAHDIQPYAATPSLQTAMVLEVAGDLDGAATAATQATEEEPTNFRTWLVLSRLEAERGNVIKSIAAYREARSLNPRSALFQ